MTSTIKNIVQFAVVTPDADAAVKTLCSLLNLGPLKVWDFKYPSIFDTTIDNKLSSWTMKLAFGWIGAMQFEVIEPTGGESLYKEYLDKWNHAGVQHLLIDRGAVTYQRMKELLAEASAPIMNEAKTNVAVQIGPFILPPLPMFLAKSMATTFGYTSTLNTLKIVIETSQYPPGVKPRQGIRMGVPTYWSEGDKNNFEESPSDSLITGIEGFIVLVKNINEIKTNYMKLFGEPKTVTDNELTFQLETTFLKIIQPANNPAYEKVMADKGEGIQILVVTPRHKIRDNNNQIFTQKGFRITDLNTATTLFTHSEMPFQIEIHHE